MFFSLAFRRVRWRAGETWYGDFTFPHRLAEALERFSGQVLLITSGSDLTAQEFLDAAGRSRRWRRLRRGRFFVHRALPGADHTFSRRVWNDQVSVWTCQSLQERVTTSGRDTPGAGAAGMSTAASAMTTRTSAPIS